MEDPCYDLAIGQLRACAELERLEKLTFPSRIQQGHADSMMQVLALISKTHLRLHIEPRITDLDYLIDLWRLYRTLAAQLRWAEALERLRHEAA